MPLHQKISVSVLNFIVYIGLHLIRVHKSNYVTYYFLLLFKHFNSYLDITPEYQEFLDYRVNNPGPTSPAAFDAWMINGRKDKPGFRGHRRSGKMQNFGRGRRGRGGEGEGKGEGKPSVSYDY